MLLLQFLRLLYGDFMIGPEYNLLVSDLYDRIPREQIESPAGQAILKYFFTKLVLERSGASSGERRGRMLTGN